MHTIFVLVGKYASGKKTIAKELIKRGYKQLISDERTDDQLRTHDFYIATPFDVLYDGELASEDIRFITIYIMTRTDIRWQRAKKDGCAIDEFHKTLRKDNEMFLDFDLTHECNYAVKNDNIKKTVNLIEYIMLLETGEIECVDDKY